MNGTTNGEESLVDHENPSRQSILEEEEGVQQKIDEDGNWWTKIYLEDEVQLNNWAKKYLESVGKAGMKVEEIDSIKIQCHEVGGEKIPRIWLKERQ